MTADLFVPPRRPLTADHRPLLIAMNNPVSSDPAHALYPAPEGCAGWRLWTMLSAEALLAEPPLVITRVAYTRAFDRRNVLSAKMWSRRDARLGGQRLMDEFSGLGRRAVVLGVDTLVSLGLPRPRDWGRWTEAMALEYCLLPHPSGRCREYNDPAMRALAGRTLLELYQS